MDQNELDPDAQPGGGEGDPCSDPATALDWNVDAAAAKAYAEFLKRGREEDNDTDGFLSRERHVYIYQRPDGSVYFGPLATGLQGQVQGDETGIAPDILIGSVHNHPGGTWAPSGTDWSNFDHITNWMTLPVMPTGSIPNRDQLVKSSSGYKLDPAHVASYDVKASSPLVFHPEPG